MLAVMGRTGSKKEWGKARLFPATISTIIVSPIILPKPNIIAATRPEPAAGTTTFLIVIHFVAPKARLASLNLKETLERASSQILAMVGRAAMATRIEAVRAFKPFDKRKIFAIRGARNKRPISPRTTDGILAIISIRGLNISLIFGEAISDR